jgi:hypothetical protein
MTYTDEIYDTDDFFEDDRYDDLLVEWENERDALRPEPDSDLTDEEIEEAIAAAERRDEDAEWARGCG